MKINTKNLEIKIVFLTDLGEHEVSMKDAFVFQHRADARNIQFENLNIEQLYENNCELPKDRNMIFKTYFKIYDGANFVFATSNLRGNSSDPNSLTFLSFDGWRELITTEMFDTSVCIDEINDEVEHIHRTINQIYFDVLISGKIHEKVRDLLINCNYQLREIHERMEEWNKK